MVSLSEVLWSPGMNGGEGWPWKSFMHSSSYGLYLSFIRWIFFLRVIKLKSLQNFQTNVCKSVGKKKYVLLDSLNLFKYLLVYLAKLSMKTHWQFFVFSLLCNAPKVCNC